MEYVNRFMEKRFIIWGAGKAGRVLYDILGSQCIIAYIESNAELQNTKYSGIPIISFETYKDNYWGYPIIVSPRDYEDEILDKLYKCGIQWAFAYSKCHHGMIAFLRQAPMNRIMSRYRKDKIIYIYGFNPLGILIYDYMTKKGYGCQMVLSFGISEIMQKCMIETLQIRSQGILNMIPNSRVLLAKELDTKDAIFINDKYTTESYYDLGDKDELYYNLKISHFEDCHHGKRCFIVATGPSLIKEDLDVLYEKKELCIGVNGIFNIFDRTKWRPDYYIIGDPSGTRVRKKEILEMDLKAKFISDAAWKFYEGDVTNSMYKWHLQYKWIDGEEPEFSEDFARKGCWGWTITYDGGLQLAAYMGFSEIYLLGVDCVQYTDPKKQHFVGNYASEPSYLTIDNILLAYQSANKYAKSHGIKIYNATRGGNLEIFERVDFDSLF